MHNLTARTSPRGNAAARIAAALRSSALAGMAVAALTLGTTCAAADLFTGKGLEGFSLQPPLNALGPIASNGTWTAEDTAVVAAGTTAPWTIQTAGAAGDGSSTATNRSHCWRRMAEPTLMITSAADRN